MMQIEKQFVIFGGVKVKRIKRAFYKGFLNEGWYETAMFVYIPGTKLYFLFYLKVAAWRIKDFQ